MKSKPPWLLRFRSSRSVVKMSLVIMARCCNPGPSFCSRKVCIWLFLAHSLHHQPKADAAEAATRSTLQLLQKKLLQENYYRLYNHQMQLAKRPLMKMQIQIAAIHLPAMTISNGICPIAVMYSPLNQSVGPCAEHSVKKMEKMRGSSAPGSAKGWLIYWQ